MTVDGPRERLRREEGVVVSLDDYVKTNRTFASLPTVLVSGPDIDAGNLCAMAVGGDGLSVGILDRTWHGGTPILRAEPALHLPNVGRLRFVHQLSLFAYESIIGRVTCTGMGAQFQQGVLMERRVEVGRASSYSYLYAGETAPGRSRHQGQRERPGVLRAGIIVCCHTIVFAPRALRDDRGSRGHFRSVSDRNAFRGRFTSGRGDCSSRWGGEAAARARGCGWRGPNPAGNGAVGPNGSGAEGCRPLVDAGRVRGAAGGYRRGRATAAGVANPNPARSSKADWNRRLPTRGAQSDIRIRSISLPRFWMRCAPCPPTAEVEQTS